VGGGGSSGASTSSGAGGVTPTSSAGGATGSGGAGGGSGASSAPSGGSGGTTSDAATGTSTPDSAAPDKSSHPTEAKPFEGHFYQAFSGEFSGTEAKAKCESAGGHLAIIHSAAENAFISTLAKADRPWIGLNNEADQKHYVWIDASPLDYTNWKPGQPDKPATERWVKMEADGTWDDGLILSGYMCEWDN
jgi:hypothetical protein